MGTLSMRQSKCVHLENQPETDQNLIKNAMGSVQEIIERGGVTYFNTDEQDVCV